MKCPDDRYYDTIPYYSNFIHCTVDETCHNLLLQKYISGFVITKFLFPIIHKSMKYLWHWLNPWCFKQSSISFNSFVYLDDERLCRNAWELLMTMKVVFDSLDFNELFWLDTGTLCVYIFMIVDTRKLNKRGSRR